LENLSDSEHINRAWENIKEITKTSTEESLGLFDLQHHKPWFDEESLGLLDQRKPAKMQWLQDPNQSNVGNLNKVIREANRHFRKKDKEYLIAKINGLETNSKIRNIRDLCRSM
jgi:hypothetical protein